jgi:hypothetical protein
MIPGGAVFDVACTGDTLALSAGVGEIEPFVLGCIEDRLVAGNLDGFALFGEFDLVVLDLLVRHLRRALFFGFSLFELAALATLAAAFDGDRAATAAERAVHRLGEGCFRNRCRTLLKDLLGDIRV